MVGGGLEGGWRSGGTWKRRGTLGSARREQPETLQTGKYRLTDQFSHTAAGNEVGLKRRGQSRVGGTLSAIVRMEGESGGELQPSETKDSLEGRHCRQVPHQWDPSPFRLFFLFFYTNQTKEIILVWVLYLYFPLQI